MPIGLGAQMGKGGIVKSIPSHVTDNLKMLHRYNTGSVVPVSDGAAYFDFSADDYISIPDHADLRLGANDFSLAAWFYTTDVSADQPIFGKKHDAYERWYWMIDGSNKVTFFAQKSNGSGGGTTVLSNTSDSTISTHKWYHIALTVDRNGNSVTYINGALDKSVSTHANGTNNLTDAWEDGTNAEALLIGARTTSTTFGDGYICNAGFWNGTILTQAQIKSIMWKNYAGLIDSEKTNLKGWWNLDSQVGSDGNAGSGYVLNEVAGSGSTTGLGQLI